MTISPIALAAKKVIDAAWQNGPSYDLASQAAFALESSQLLHSPETAVEHERLRTERDRYRLAWRMAYQRAMGRGWAADRAGSRVHELHEALQAMLFTVIGSQLARKAAIDEATELRARIAELEAEPTTVYRAEHPDSGITLGHYCTEAAARAHCEATERRSWPTGTTLVFDWIEDDEDRVAELVVTAGQNEESTTGYLVTALEAPSEYDEEADE